ncbi:GNAT family N-acetyltransferase [Croceitalea sp. MTPC5]|uniref:GNAT family N-acetyltransferase n=1 Tax=Croceitalea sp. MTPC5 TaxID=3056565 RepID=UPI002B3892FB|nr:GNAT family N-acetyltransferase [Croceitalea sp. MTPC5]
MEVSIKHFDELTTSELYAILRLRSEVFVVEQNCVYQDIDAKDQKAIHIIGSKKGEVVAYTRIFKAGDYFKNTAIGRVVVKKSEREYGYGRTIMEASLDYISKTLQEKGIELSAQTYLLRFYSDLGFKKTGKEYLEDGIPHIRMFKSNA